MLCSAWIGLGAGLLPRRVSAGRSGARDRDAGGLRHLLRLRVRAADEPLVVALRPRRSRCPATRARCRSCPARRWWRTCTASSSTRCSPRPAAGTPAGRSPTRWRSCVLGPGGPRHPAPGRPPGVVRPGRAPRTRDVGQPEPGTTALTGGPMVPCRTACSGWPPATRPGRTGCASLPGRRRRRCSTSGSCTEDGCAAARVLRARPARARPRRRAGVLKISFPDEEAGARAPRPAALARRRRRAAAPRRPAPLRAAARAAARRDARPPSPTSRPARSSPGSTRRLHVPALPQLHRLSSVRRAGGSELARAAAQRPGPAPAGGAGRVAGRGPRRPTPPPTGAWSTATCTTTTCWPPTASRGWSSTPSR